MLFCGSSQNAGQGSGSGSGSGSGCHFFPNFCRYSTVLLFSDVRNLSFIYGGNKQKKQKTKNKKKEHTKATKLTFLFVFRN